MAVWNTRKTQVSQSTSEEKNSNAISRINRLIAEENEKIEKCCLEIGKKYVQLYASNYEEEFEDIMQTIALSQKKLGDYSMQMQFVTGVIVCTECGHKAPKGSVFCNMCGSKMPAINFDNFEMCDNCGRLIEKGAAICPSCALPTQQQKENLVQCPKCKKLVGKDNRFCPNCAAHLNNNEASNIPDNMPRDKKCPRCGAIMRPNMRFCTECAMELI